MGCDSNGDSRLGIFLGLHDLAVFIGVFAPLLGMVVWEVGCLKCGRPVSERRREERAWCKLRAPCCSLLCWVPPKGFSGYSYWSGKTFYVGLNTSSWPDTRICRHVPKGKIKIIFPTCRLNQKSFGLGFGWSKIRASAVCFSFLMWNAELLPLRLSKSRLTSTSRSPRVVLSQPGVFGVAEMRSWSVGKQL